MLIKRTFDNDESIIVSVTPVVFADGKVGLRYEGSKSIIPLDPENNEADAKLLKRYIEEDEVYSKPVKPTTSAKLKAKFFKKEEPETVEETEDDL